MHSAQLADPNRLLVTELVQIVHVAATGVTEDFTTVAAVVLHSEREIKWHLGMKSYASIHNREAFVAFCAIINGVIGLPYGPTEGSCGRRGRRRLWADELHVNREWSRTRGAGGRGFSVGGCHSRPCEIADSLDL